MSIAKTNFEDPPVAESVIGVQFTPLSDMRITDFGLFWQKVQERFPEVQERDRLVPVFEHKEQVIPQKGWRLSHVFELPRVWFLGELKKGGRHFVQLQPDRFLYNWSAGLEKSTYPSFETNRGAFFEYFTIWQEYVSECGWGGMEIDQSELTYVNHIELDAGMDLTEMAVKTFTVFENTAAVPGKRDRFTFNVSSWLDSLNGRIHASIQPAQSLKTKKVIMDFRLTARGAPESSSPDDLEEWFKQAHTVATDCFKSLTTEEMHGRWGIVKS